ncbi:MAG: response regulator [Planctomycetota bacterium]
MAITPNQPIQERDQQLQSLLDRLDAKDAVDDGRRDRRSARATFRRSGVRITVHHPGGSSTERSVLTRDLSAGGLSFIHGGYLHIDTRCDVELGRYVGGKDSVRGIVQRCDHIAGHWHTVGVKFDRRIFPKLYLDPEHADSAELDVRNPQSICGRVLLLDDSELDRRLMQHHLRRTRVELTGVATLADAVEAIAGQSADNPFKLAIVDLNLAGEDASLAPGEVVSRIVNAAVPKVAACSAETDAGKLKEARDAGVCGVLNKPYDTERLLTCIATWLGSAGLSIDSKEAIFSTMAAQPEMKELISEFVQKARDEADRLRTAAEAEDLATCRAIAVGLRGGGSGFGFAAVSDAASELVTGLDSTMSVSDSAVALQRLQEVCGRLSADAEQSEDANEQPRAIAA